MACLQRYFYFKYRVFNLKPTTMKRRIKLPIIQLILMGVALIWLTSCDKNENSETVEDINGNVYNTSVIGDQVWMVENLRTVSFRDGSLMLTQLYDDFEWASAGAACTIYPHSEIDGLDSEAEVSAAYGRLYNWIAVNDSRGLCPVGWRVPTEEDWDELIEYLGGEDVAGGKLKNTRTSPTDHPRWDSPNTGATDEKHFSALPAGYRTSLGQFDFLGSYGEWWSSTEYNTDLAITRYISNYETGMYHSYGRKRAGYSVRCIKE